MRPIRNHPGLVCARSGRRPRGYFFGRALELQEFFERVLHKPLTVLFGQSGLGKTSLIQAGLVPRLRDAALLPVRIRLRYYDHAGTPGQQMIDALRQELDRGGQGDLSKLCGEASNLWLLLHDPRFGFINEGGSPVIRPVFIFDQFEEIFTLGEKRREMADDFRGKPWRRLSRIECPMRFAGLSRATMGWPSASIITPIRRGSCCRSRRLPALARTLAAATASFMATGWSCGPWRRGGAYAAPLRNRGVCVRANRQLFGGNRRGHMSLRGNGAQPHEVPGQIDAVPPLLSLMCAELNAQRLAAGEENNRGGTAGRPQRAHPGKILFGYIRESSCRRPRVCRGSAPFGRAIASRSLSTRPKRNWDGLA